MQACCCCNFKKERFSVGKPLFFDKILDAPCPQAQNKVSESVKPAIKQGIKKPKPLISQGFQVSVSILVTQYGSGRRIRTLTYGVRVRCATITQSRYVVLPAALCRSANKRYYSRNSRFVNRKFSKNRILEKLFFFGPVRPHIQMANRRSSGSNTRRRTPRFSHSSAVTRWLCSTIKSMSSSSDSIIGAP